MKIGDQYSICHVNDIEKKQPSIFEDRGEDNVGNRILWCLNGDYQAILIHHTDGKFELYINQTKDIFEVKVEDVTRSVSPIRETTLEEDQEIPF